MSDKKYLVYKDDFDKHIENKTNPHGVTKSQIGLEKVENKSSETIRKEITKDNVSKALGYTPADDNDIPFGEEYGETLLELTGKMNGSSFDDYTWIYDEKTRTTPVLEQCEIGDLVEIRANDFIYTGRVKEFTYPEEEDGFALSMRYVGNAGMYDYEPNGVTAPDTGEKFFLVDFYINDEYVFEGESSSGFHSKDIAEGTEVTVIVRPLTVVTLPYKYAPYEEVVFDVYGAIDVKTSGVAPITIESKKCENLNFFKNMKLTDIDDIVNALLTKGKIRFFGPITRSGISSTATNVPHICRITSVSPGMVYDPDIWVLDMRGVLKISNISNMDFHFDISITSMDNITMTITAKAISLTPVTANS